MMLCFVPPGGKAKHRRWLLGCCRPRAVHDAYAVGMRKWSRAQVRTWLEVFDGGTFASSVPHDKVYKSLDGPTMSDSPMRLIREAYEDPDIVAQYQFAVNYWRLVINPTAGTLRCAVLSSCTSYLTRLVRLGAGNVGPFGMHHGCRRFHTRLLLRTGNHFSSRGCACRYGTLWCECCRRRRFTNTRCCPQPCAPQRWTVHT